MLVHRAEAKTTHRGGNIDVQDRLAVSELAKMIMTGGVTVDPLDKAPTVDDVRLLARNDCRRWLRLHRRRCRCRDHPAGQRRRPRAGHPAASVAGGRLRAVVDHDSLVRPLPMPVLLGPCGLMRLAGGDGELVRRSGPPGKAGLTYTISTASSWSIEEIAAEASAAPVVPALHVAQPRGRHHTGQPGQGGRLHGAGGHGRRGRQQQAAARPPQRHVDPAADHRPQRRGCRPAPGLVRRACCTARRSGSATCRASPRDRARCPTRST